MQHNNWHPCWHPPQSEWCQTMIDCLFVDAQMCSVRASINLATLHKTDSSIRNTTTLRQVFFKATIHSQPHHTPPTMGTGMGNISTNHNHATVPTWTGAPAVPEGKHYTPHPATAVACTALWTMDTPIATCTMTHPTAIFIPYPTLTTSPTDITYATFPWTGANITPATLTTLHKKHSQWGKPSNTQDLQPSECHTVPVHAGNDFRLRLALKQPPHWPTQMYIIWSRTTIKPKFCLQQYTSKQQMDHQCHHWARQPCNFTLQILNSHILSLYVTSYQKLNFYLA